MPHLVETASNLYATAIRNINVLLLPSLPDSHSQDLLTLAKLSMIAGRHTLCTFVTSRIRSSLPDAISLSSHIPSNQSFSNIHLQSPIARLDLVQPVLWAYC